MVNRKILFVLLVAAIAPYFVGLGDSSIWDANEAFYVETPREMIERGDYVRPTFNYEPRLNKPVLSYWIVAAFYKVFGISVAVQRVAIALGALALIAAAFMLARATAPENGHTRDAGTVAALWAAIGLAIAPRLVMFARRIFIDIYTSAFMALTLAFFALAERYPQRRRLFLSLMYVAVGVGTLTKGPVALVLPGLVFAIYLLVHRELRRIDEMMIPTGILIVSAIVVPWYVALYFRGDAQYILTFLLGENIGRYTEGMGESARRGALFYLPVVFSDSFPWSMLLVAAGIQWWRHRQGATAALPSRVRTLLWLWVLVIVAFFSFSQTKQDLYIFPIVPAIAALGAVFVVEASRPPLLGWLRGTVCVTGVILVLGGAASWYWVRGLATAYGVAGITLIGVLAVGGGAATVFLAYAGRPIRGLVVLAATVIVVNWIFVLRVLPSVEPYKPSPVFARTVAARAGPGDIVAHFNVAMPSMVFYLQRRIEVHYDLERFAEILRSGAGVYAVLWAADYDAVTKRSGVETCVIERRATLEAKLKDVLARAPLPEVLLVTTECR
jgi:4-amino-4-deoxy-L-arabinose transferase-like glycosyltransferase